MGHPTVLLTAAFGLFLIGCSAGNDSGDASIVLDTQPAPSQKVENGTAYDQAAVDLGKAKKVVLPDSATIRRAREAGKVQLFMAKTLSFGGHPPEPMSIRGARKNMGCAVQVEEDSLVVATYGEWESRIEGGAHMKLLVIVPDGVEIEQRKGLSGPGSAGREWHGQYLTKPKDAQGGYWYGPASPADGWTAVPAVPDGTRTASK